MAWIGPDASSWEYPGLPNPNVIFQMNPPDPDPVNEWNIDASWQDWPHGGLWKSPIDGEVAPPASDPTAVSSAMTGKGEVSSPISASSSPSMFDVGRSLSESDLA